MTSEALAILRANPTTVEVLIGATGALLGAFVANLWNWAYIRKLEDQLKDKDTEIEIRALFTRDWRDKARQLAAINETLQSQFDQMDRIAENERGQRLAAQSKLAAFDVKRKKRGAHGHFLKESL